jgi:hypothetical protein
MRKSILLGLLSLVLLPPASAGQSGLPQPLSAVSGVKCEQPTPAERQIIVLKHALCDAQCFARAKAKAELSDLLRQSLYDDAEGIVNVPRKHRIKKLLNELRKSP